MMTLGRSWTFYGKAKFALLTAEDYGMKAIRCPLTKMLKGFWHMAAIFGIFFKKYTTAIRFEALLYCKLFFVIINDHIISPLILLYEYVFFFVMSINSTELM